MEFSLPEITKGLVIGAGPSIDRHNHLELLKKSRYQGKLIVTDLVLEKVLSAGITPDKFPHFYVVSSEDGGDVQPLFHHKIIGKWADKIRIVLFTVHPDVESYIRNLKMTVRVENDTYETNLLANVGAMCWYVAWKFLCCTEIAMIGMNQGHGIEHLEKFSPKLQELFFKHGYNPIFKKPYVLDPIYQYFSKTFTELLEKMPAFIRTINCTEEGSIFQYVDNMTLNDYLNK